MSEILIGSIGDDEYLAIIFYTTVAGLLTDIDSYFRLLEMNSASPLSSSFVASHRRSDMVVGPVGSSSGSSGPVVTAASAPGTNNNNNNLPNFREQAALQQQILQVSSGDEWTDLDGNVRRGRPDESISSTFLKRPLLKAAIQQRSYFFFLFLHHTTSRLSHF